ncbi:small membrane protein YoaI [Dryocola clanedunensis]
MNDPLFYEVLYITGAFIAMISALVASVLLLERYRW